ncbi:BTAD domain-containing putative transcriptional regulator [Streptomyces sp. B1866]|uniref:AfsR/SARP family transcriptional regulator n=1 Tax=Streptomyces sp. B1866 TaxID=3075431 RepID=UPI00288E1F21|nr:BTAD domain-containing putative transcriptional regulator [Streptomyces sp. B1866]MDT3399572.1 BTAD domain-containing putative transcriptional regulator [Streptomyces sp. B1866]
MRFQVLGNFEVLAGTRVRTPSAPKLRRALALLILRQGEVVPTKVLIDELWGSRPPEKAVRAVHTYIYELRRALVPAAGESGECILQTRPSGYMARVPGSAIDVTAFRALVKEGRSALDAADPATARELLGRGLSLWQGSALANLERGELLEAHATELEESRLRALELRIEADFQLHRHQELAGELKALTAASPLHEGLHAKLMLALYRSGRRSEALKVFQDLRRHLVAELGLEPGPELQRLQRAMLAAAPALDPPPAAPALPPRRAPAPPAQLPRDTADFTGRQALLAELDGLLAAGGGTGLPVVSLVGMPGVGKTATAVHLAHAVRARYPDGQLYVPLGGSDPVSRTPRDALEQILRGVGVPADDVPGTLSGRTALFRTFSCDRRLLLVLDDAAGAEQVEPLLPGGAGCAVLITSRSLLYGLRGTRTVPLSRLSVREGVDLLARMAGRERTDAEPEASAEAVRLTDGLPLALVFLGERLAAMGPVSVSSVVARIRAARGRHRLSELAALGLDLYGRLEACLRRLDEDTQAAFLRLALLPRSLFTAAQAARSLGTDLTTADMALMRLTDASLVEAVEVADVTGAGGGAPGITGVAEGRTGGQRHYRFGELVREFARERMADAAVAADGSRHRISS